MNQTGELNDQRDLPTTTGRFGAEMQVELVNDGPVTIWLDSRDLVGSGTLA